MANKMSDKWTPWLTLNRQSPLKLTLWTHWRDISSGDNILICLLASPFSTLKTAFWRAIILNNRPEPMEDATRYHGNDYDGFVDRQSR